LENYDLPKWKEASNHFPSWKVTSGGTPFRRRDKEQDVSEIDEARAAMAEIRATEQRLSERMQWPFWRHLAAGLGIGVLMIAATFESGQTVIVSFGVVLFAIYLKNRDKKRHGMFVSGLTKGRARWITFAVIAFGVAACLYVNLGVAEPQREQPVFWVLLTVTVAATTALSYLWQRVNQRELQGNGQ
jgi:uncharacterized membrane protein YhhN